jgi:nucleotide-binding universal stress UspA family protein
MKTRIILLTDFSPQSENLLAFAGKLAESIRADLLLVHQVPGMVPALADNASRSQIIGFEKEQAMRKLKELAGQIGPLTPSLDYWVSEKPISVLLQELLHQGFDDLILLGLKGTGLLKQTFLGSTATKVIEEVDAITLAVPLKNPSQPHTLTIAVSYRYPLNEAALGKLLTMLKQEIKTIEFITIVTASDVEAESVQYLAGLHERFESLIPSSISVFRGGTAFSEIKAHLQQYQDHMLVVQKGSRTLSDKFFRRFLIHDLVHDGSMPLLVLPL